MYINENPKFNHAGTLRPSEDNFENVDLNLEDLKLLKMGTL
jgi:hypothetical protein